jgi:hypothetical protein
MRFKRVNSEKYSIQKPRKGNSITRWGPEAINLQAVESQSKKRGSSPVYWKIPYGVLPLIIGAGNI